MFQFIRTATPKNGGSIAPALQFAAEVTGFVNKRYGIGLRFGIRLFGGSDLYWQFDTDSIDQITVLNAKLMQDREYLALLDRAKDLWVDGSLQDAIVSNLG
jgi:hypothetical protein